jgi:phage terminase large subunit
LTVQLLEMKAVLLGRGYTYARQVLPHDGGNVNSHTEQTDAQLLEGFGLKVELQERTKDVERDVNGLRVLLPRCRFDKARCAGLLASLRNHRQEKDEKTGLWRFKHDWTSHAVSSFRGFSVYQAEHGLRVRAANDNAKPRRAVAC